jgi:hypothetical protein
MTNVRKKLNKRQGEGRNIGKDKVGMRERMNPLKSKLV